MCNKFQSFLSRTVEKISQRSEDIYLRFIEMLDRIWKSSGYVSCLLPLKFVRMIRKISIKLQSGACVNIIMWLQKLFGIISTVQYRPHVN